MDKQTVKSNKSLIVLSLILLIIVSFSIFIFPKIDWKNFNINNLAAVFPANYAGDWNNMYTWGISSGLVAFIAPEDVDFSSNGYIYVADSNRNRVVVLNPDGSASTTYNNMDATYATSGFSLPTGIAISPLNGNIYVVDAQNYRIVVLNPDGTASTSISDLSPLSPSAFSFYHGPWGINISSTTGYIYIADPGNARIVVLNPDGTASTSYKNLDALYSPNGLSNPSGIGLSPLGDIYISDGGSNGDDSNGRIVVLNPDGTASTTLSAGLGFNYTDGIEFSPDGDIYISDKGNNRVVVLNPDGSASTTFSGGISAPRGIDFDSSGYVHVVSRGNNRVYVFDSDLIYSHYYDGLQLPSSFVPIEGTHYPGPIDDVIIRNAVTLTQEHDVNNFRLEYNGTLDLNGYPLNVGGDWINGEGNFVANGGTINFVGTSTQIISGENTFYNLIRNSSSTSSIIFDESKTTTITGDIIINGAPNNLITLEIPSAQNYVFSSMATSVEALGGFQGIYGVTLDSSGDLYIVESSGRIQKLDTSFSGISSFTYSGCGPFNIVLDSSDNIYVSDHCQRVLKFDSSGNLLQTIGSSTPNSGTGAGEFNTPRGLAFATSGDLYVVDQYNSRIQKFDSSGNFISTFGWGVSDGSLELQVCTSSCQIGISGSGDGQFSSPNGIAIDSENFIYVADSSNHRIQKFDSSGNFISTFGEYPPGLDDGHLAYPTSLTLDDEGNMYIVDYGNDRVQVFDNEGNYITKFGYPGTGESQFDSVWNIAIDSSRNLYVTDYNNNRISKFSPDTSNSFNIFHTGSGTTSFSYLRVTGSNNLSTEPFYCLVGCVDGGGNTNWVFPARSSRRVITETQDPPTLTTFRIIPENTSIALGSTKQFQAELLDQYGNPIYEKIYWYSSDTSVGTINDAGLFHSQKEGTTTIRALISNGQIATTTQIAVVKNIPSSETTEEQPQIEEEIQPESRVEEEFCFTSNLFPAPANNNPLDVLKLQTFLNDNNFTISTSGPGSYENETYFYGTKTTDAVKRFQEAYADEILTAVGKVEGTGIFANYTRKKVNDLLNHGCVTVFESYAITTEEEEEIVEEEVVEPEIPEVVIPIPETPTEVPPQETQTPTENSQEPTQQPQTNTESKFLGIVDQSIVLGITETITTSYKEVMIIVNDGIAKLKTIMSDSTIDIAAKIVSTSALVLGVTAAISSIAFATPVSFAEIWLIPGRISGLILGTLGIRRKNREWGTVYDSVTKRPLDPVYVSLISIETGKEVAGAITDIDGRYGFLVLPGKYRIEAKKTNYIQPSVKMKGKSYDEVYNDLYFGEELTITQEGETITKNIPMDSLSFDWNEFAKTKMNVNKFTRQKDITWAKLSKLVFVIGALVSIIAVVAAPQPYNYIIVGFYFLAYILNFIVFKSKKSGTLTEKDTRAPLSFAIVKIYREGETVPLTKKIADKFGAYYALVPRGNYYISVEKKMDDGTYVEIFRSGVAEIKSGVIDEDLVL
jgi:sugar lactone lactonase YvrE